MEQQKSFIKRFWWMGLIILVIITVVFYLLLINRNSNSIQSDVNSESVPVEVAAQREQIETAYPEFKDFENQGSFAGKSVKTLKDGNDLYVAYMVLGSGVPIVQATCFRVDWMRRVYRVGEFPIGIDSYAGYRDIDPKNCNGIK